MINILSRRIRLWKEWTDGKFLTGLDRMEGGMEEWMDLRTGMETGMEENGQMEWN